MCCQFTKNSDVTRHQMTPFHDNRFLPFKICLINWISLIEQDPVKHVQKSFRVFEFCRIVLVQFNKLFIREKSTDTDLMPSWL